MGVMTFVMIFTYKVVSQIVHIAAATICIALQSTIFNPYMFKQLRICCSADSVYCHYKEQGMRSTNNSCIPCMIHPQYIRSFATEAATRSMWLQNCTARQQLLKLVVLAPRLQAQPSILLQILVLICLTFSSFLAVYSNGCELRLLIW